MKYSYDDLKLSVEPCEWNRNSPKEILQYAVGALLYSPATNTKIAIDIIEKKNSKIKSLCLCLEDAIGDDAVKQAELCLKDTLHQLYVAVEEGKLTINEIPLIFIRVREPKQVSRIYRICGTRNFSMVTGFNLPKFNKDNCDAYLEEFDKVLQAYMKSNKRPIYIMPIIEDKNVMYRQRRMDQLIYINDKLVLYSDYVLNIRVGATDFCGIFGIRRPIDAKIYDMSVINDCLSDIINVFARNYVCSGPVWEYFNSEGIPGAWSEGLKKELRFDKLNGFCGKTCIHPTQLKYIQENCVVTYENYKDAISILGMSNGLAGVKKGYNNNKMNEVKPHTSWARKVVGMAEVYGVLAEETENV